MSLFQNWLLVWLQMHHPKIGLQRDEKELTFNVQENNEIIPKVYYFLNINMIVRDITELTFHEWKFNTGCSFLLTLPVFIK